METPHVFHTDENGPLVAQSAAMREVLDWRQRSPGLDARVDRGGAGYRKGLGGPACPPPEPAPRRAVRAACLRIAPRVRRGQKLFGQVGWGQRTDQRRPPGLLESARRGTLFLDDVSQLPRLDPNQAARRSSAGRGTGVRRHRQRDTGRAADRGHHVRPRNRRPTGRFHPALYYYLNVVRIRVPPLRKRREDIRALADRFLLQVGSVVARRQTAPPGIVPKRHGVAC